MKKVIVTVLATVLVMGVGAFAGGSFAPDSASVTPASTLILPAVNPLYYTDNGSSTWEAAGVTKGEYFQVASNNWIKYFICVTAGTTATNYPTWSVTALTTNGTAVFKYVEPRTKAILTNISTGSVSIAKGNTAVLNKGIVLLGNAYGIYPTDYLGEVNGIAGAGVTNTIAIDLE